MPVHEYNVEMTCEGCSNAVERVLKKHKGEGIDTIKIDLPNKKIFVGATKTADEVLEIIKKTGKKVEYISSQ